MTNDTRAHPQQHNAPAGATGPAAVAPVSTTPVVLCRDCKHWDRRWPQANHAQCLQATKYASGGGVLLTTDLQTCSQAEPRAR